MGLVISMSGLSSRTFFSALALLACVLKSQARPSSSVTVKSKAQPGSSPIFSAIAVTLGGE